MKVILFAGAEIRDYSFCESYMDGVDAVICCDAGMRHAKALGIDPDYIVGDFDSTASEVLEYYCLLYKSEAADDLRSGE